MNQWDKIWNKRNSSLEKTEDTFDMYCKLKSANGFDTQDIDGYYESFYEQCQKMRDKIIAGCDGTLESVYEVGCGSGVNLYVFQKFLPQLIVGGMDYSAPLIQIAKNVIESNDLSLGEALQIESEDKYDVVLSDSVFQYFQSPEYGMKVLEKMYDKAKKMIVVTEIHDMELFEEHMEYRRSCVENYDEKYKGLEKTFYKKQDFINFAKEKQCRYEIIKPDNKIYWNNEYVFDFYLYKA